MIYIVKERLFENSDKHNRVAFITGHDGGLFEGAWWSQAGSNR